jgi:hypothetical protein
MDMDRLFIAIFDQSGAALKIAMILSRGRTTAVAGGQGAEAFLT